MSRKIIKQEGIFLISIKLLRVILRKITGSATFLSQKTKQKVIEKLESLAPEEIIKFYLKDLGIEFYYPNKSIIGLRACEFGYWNYYNTLLKFLSNPRTIVEVGSNIGIDTIFMSKKLKPKNKIIAFEPCIYYRIILKKNIAKNDIRNIKVYPYFVSSENNKKIKIYENLSSASAIQELSEFFPPYRSEICNTITLDYFFTKKHQINSLDLIKIDTDGWDQHVIEGSKKIISRFHPFLLIEFSGYALKKASFSNFTLARLLNKLGYRFFILMKDKKLNIITGYKALLRLLDINTTSDVFAIHESKEFILNNYKRGQKKTI